MADKPILFSGPMVRALLDGRKTQTRRVMKPQPNTFPITFEGARRECFVDTIQVEGRDRLNIALHGGNGGGVIPIYELPHQIGDRLWVREAWRPAISAVDPWHVAVLYPCDGLVKHWGWATDADFGDWTIPKAAAKGNVPSIHMPRWASRLTLVVTDVKVQRVREISEADARDEGARLAMEPVRKLQGWTFDELNSRAMARDSFKHLWDSLNAKRGFGWDANPWVTATTFTVHHCNIDQMEARP